MYEVRVWDQARGRSEDHGPVEAWRVDGVIQHYAWLHVWARWFEVVDLVTGEIVGTVEH
jgi:hypothetical protein